MSFKYQKKNKTTSQVFLKLLWWLHHTGNLHSLDLLDSTDYNQVYIQESWVSYASARLCALTCLLVCLLVWPDNRAEVGEDQRSQSAGAFLRSTVVVEGVLAQHEPVPTLLDPVSSYLKQQPPFQSKTQSATLKPASGAATWWSF